MLSITNLNSSQTINYNEDKIIALSGILSEKMKKVPVYLVDEQTMDKLYPPQKRKLLDEECLKELLNHEGRKITTFSGACFPKNRPEFDLDIYDYLIQKGYLFIPRQQWRKNGSKDCYLFLGNKDYIPITPYRGISIYYRTPFIYLELHKNKGCSLILVYDKNNRCLNCIINAIVQALQNAGYSLTNTSYSKVVVYTLKLNQSNWQSAIDYFYDVLVPIIDSVFNKSVCPDCQNVISKITNEEFEELKQKIGNRIKGKDGRKEDIEEIFDRCSKESIFVAVGLYLRNIPSWLYNQFNSLREPAIFICPERCISWGDELNIPSDFVFTEILFHEYAHAYLDVDRSSDYYNTSWGKIIEESLANYIAYTRLESMEDKANAIKLISDQPLEYRCSLALIEEHRFIPPIPFRRHWYLEDLFDYLHYLYRRYGILPYNFSFNLDRIWKEYKKSNDKDLERFFKHLAFDLVKSLIQI